MTLESLCNGLDRFAKTLDKGINHVLLKRLGEYGVEYAKSQVLNVDTGETANSINYKIEGNKLIIEAGGNAVWLEFGTGIARNPTEYPVQVDGIVGHGQYGKGNGANPNGWYYPSDTPMGASYDADITQYTYSGTYINHTLGIEANMFMWKTADVLEQKAAEWGMEIVDKGIRYD